VIADEDAMFSDDETVIADEDAMLCQCYFNVKCYLSMGRRRDELLRLPNANEVLSAMALP